MHRSNRAWSAKFATLGRSIRRSPIVSVLPSLSTPSVAAGLRSPIPILRPLGSFKPIVRVLRLGRFLIMNAPLRDHAVFATFRQKTAVLIRDERSAGPFF